MSGSKAEKSIIINICTIFNEYIYDSNLDEAVKKSKATYRYYVFDECLKICVKYKYEKKFNVSYIPGETELNAMTIQLKEATLVDGCYEYNADVIICTNSHALDILLAEVPHGYGSNDLNKISFDHSRAMFGMLAMINTIAQKYYLVQLSTFKKLKVHFLHGFDRFSYLVLYNMIAVH
ncbi:unnamed protein product [Rhizopus stolonifer]